MNPLEEILAVVNSWNKALYDLPPLEMPSHRAEPWDRKKADNDNKEVA